jgi:hypothetical protein
MRKRTDIDYIDYITLNLTQLTFNDVFSGFIQSINFLFILKFILINFFVYSD